MFWGVRTGINYIQICICKSTFKEMLRVPASRDWIQRVFTKFPFSHTCRAPAHQAPADPAMGASWLLGKCPLQANSWQSGVTSLRTACQGLRHPCSGHTFPA